MNDVALRANDVLRNDVGLRPMKLRFAQTYTPLAWFGTKTLQSSRFYTILITERRWRIWALNLWGRIIFISHRKNGLKKHRLKIRFCHSTTTWNKYIPNFIIWVWPKNSRNQACNCWRKGISGIQWLQGKIRQIGYFGNWYCGFKQCFKKRFFEWI